MKTFTILFLLLIINHCLAQDKSKIEKYLQQKISLQGEWQLALDTAKVGIKENWVNKTYSDHLYLPGTLTENGKGLIDNSTKKKWNAAPKYRYSGWAWYQKEILIPAGWKDKQIRLVLERTKLTHVWIDGIFLGNSDNIVTSQEYDFPNSITAGKHKITILVDNSNKALPFGIGAFAWSIAWGGSQGIIGKIYLEALNKIRIEDLQVYPDINQKHILVKMNIKNSSNQSVEGAIQLSAHAWNTSIKHVVPVKSYKSILKSGDNIVEFTYEIGNKMQLWSEFSPVLYQLKASLSSGDLNETDTVNFGMRQFSTAGTQFTVNGAKTFLRGKHEGAIFPIKGYIPTDLESWLHSFRISKSYGINHIRFHSSTPPEAVFVAADIVGMYVQAELPYMGGMPKGNVKIDSFMLKEGSNVLQRYGNHPSFVLLSMGNEIAGDVSIGQEYVKKFREEDSRHLYCYGTNNFGTAQGFVPGEDYVATCRLGSDKDTTLSNQLRSYFGFVDAYYGGYINVYYPSSDVTYEKAIQNNPVPVLGHEVGQYEVYPNFNEIKKYTGLYQPFHLESARQGLIENNILDQDEDFFKASGALSIIGYKKEIETAIQTPGFGGFQLLDLQDSPQFNAVIGILDVFMDSKGLITPEKFREFNNSVVPLILTEKYCWTNNEILKGKIKVANYGMKALANQLVTWELKDTKGQTISKNSIKITIPQGGLCNIDNLNINLSKLTKAQKLNIDVRLVGTNYKNSCPLWVYPAAVDYTVPSDIVVAGKLDKATLAVLNGGGKVLLFPAKADVKDVSVGGLFPTDFWNYDNFKGYSVGAKKPICPGTMGILTKPEHPVFNDFPTDFYSNWQWWSIVKNSNPLILDKTSKSYRPIIQVIDNVCRNHKLGLVFEFAVGKGKLLICMSDLRAIASKPEARQLYSSILKYMASKNFNPKEQLSEKELVGLLNTNLQIN